MAHLSFRDLGKHFPGVQALADISFDVEAGSVHALMGENGAGKSTLLKVLAGVYVPDAGHVEIGGKSAVFRRPTEALAAGVSIIYQELHLAPDLSVAENIFLGHLPHRAGFVSRARMNEEAAQLLASLGETFAPTTRLGDLPLGQRQMVEIAKALARRASVIAFDEPTSSLSSRETERLFEVIARLRSDGKAILYVSHRMDEIYRLCDAATVLRDGRHVSTHPRLSEIPREQLIREMVGRDLADLFDYTPRPAGDVCLAVSGLEGRGLSAPAEFTARAGEIVGFFGLIGAGRSELMKLVYGAEPRKDGSVTLNNRPLPASATGAIRSGLVLCPEDRKKEGIFPLFSVQENINLSGRRHFSPGGLLRPGRERENAAKHVEALRVKTPSLDQPIGLLSGGNQQKAILGRWLSEDIRAIILDEPTRGIDVGAKKEIYRIIQDLAAAGKAVLIVSSEMAEILGLCDRVLVMRDGAIVLNLPRSEATPERLLEAALPRG